MTERLAAGVYIEEVQFRILPDPGSIDEHGGICGCYRARSTPRSTLQLFGFRTSRDSQSRRKLPRAVRRFFENGGQQCFISQIAASDPL
jgi:hypothetical protein